MPRSKSDVVHSFMCMPPATSETTLLTAQLHSRLQYSCSSTAVLKRHLAALTHLEHVCGIRRLNEGVCTRTEATRVMVTFEQLRNVDMASMKAKSAAKSLPLTATTFTSLRASVARRTRRPILPKPACTPARQGVAHKQRCIAGALPNDHHGFAAVAEKALCDRCCTSELRSSSRKSREAIVRHMLSAADNKNAPLMPTFTSSAARTTTAVRLEGRAAESFVVGASRAMVADATVELEKRSKPM